MKPMEVINMAGIGFELRKLFATKSITSKLKGIVYASFATIGPMIIFLCMLIGIHLIMNIYDVSDSHKLFFTTTTLYMLVAGIIISSSVSNVLSRYIADKIFEGKDEDICSSIYGSIFFTSLIAMLVGILLIAPMVLKYSVSLAYGVGLYYFLIMMTITYVIMIYISTIKEYTKVSLSFLIGILFGALTFVIIYYGFHIDILLSLLYGMAFSFFIINVLLLIYINKYFHSSKLNCFEFLTYYKKYPMLCISSLLYIVGIYVHNIIFWFFSDAAVNVMFLKVLPAYDMAAFLGMLINISAMVIFVVKVETTFYEKYQLYCIAIAGASYSAIEKTRKNMQETLNNELFYIYEVQLIITIVLISLGMVFFPRFNLGGMVLDYFIVLGMAFYCTFCMYFSVIFLYYLDDQKGALYTTSIFFIVTLVVSIITCNIAPSYYPLGILLGAFSSWIFSFFRIKFFIKNINKQMFCSKALIQEMKK